MGYLLKNDNQKNLKPSQIKLLRWFFLRSQHPDWIRIYCFYNAL